MPHSDPPTLSRPEPAGLTRHAGARVLLAALPGAHRDLLCEHLAADGHAVTAVDSAEQAARAQHAIGADLAIIATLSKPVEAPGLIGSLRTAGGPGLGILTLGPGGPGADLHHLRALEAGSDMHLPLTAGYVLIRAALATLDRRRTAQVGVLEVGPLRIDQATVTVHDQPLTLTRMELRLLRALAARPTQVRTKRELICEMWGEANSYGRTRALDSHACRLRAKLHQAGIGAVHTVWGIGYRLTEA